MSDYAVVIISPPGYIHNKTFLEVAETINQGLINLGHNSSIYTKPVYDRKNIVMGSNLLPAYSIELAPDSVLYNVEQIKNNPMWINDRFLEIHKQNRVWDFCKTNVDTFNELGIDVDGILPIGYVDQLTRITHHAPENDVMFCGSLNNRRLGIIDKLTISGLKLKHLSHVYGSKRDLHIGRTKLMLNIQSIRPKIFEIVRVSYYLANKMPVLSESPENIDEYKGFEEGICFADSQNFVDKAIELCNNPKMRNELAAKGFEIMSRHRIENYLKDIL